MSELCCKFQIPALNTVGLVAETRTLLQSRTDGQMDRHKGEQKYSRLSLSRNQRDPLKHFEISVLRHIRIVVLRKKINSNNQISKMTM